MDHFFKPFFKVLAVILCLGGSITGGYGAVTGNTDLLLRGIYSLAVGVSMKVVFADLAAEK